MFPRKILSSIFLTILLLVPFFASPSQVNSAEKAPAIENDEELQAIMTSAQCLKRDPKNQECAQDYQRKVTDYLQPRCSAPGINPKLAFYAARSAPNAEFNVKRSFQGQDLYAAPSASIEAKDVQSIVFHQSVGGDFIQFTTIGAQKLKEFTEKNLGQKALLVLGDKILSVPMIVEVNKSGQLVVSTTDDSLRPLCLRPLRRSLPKSAKIPQGNLRP